MKTLFLVICICLVSCGGGSSGSSDIGMIDESPLVGIQSNLIEGVWMIPEVTAGCSEIYTFSNAGEMLIFSNEEFVRATYTIDEDDDVRDQLEFQVISDNLGVDCEGDSTDDTGLYFGSFYIEHSGATMRWYDSFEGGNLLATFEYIDQDLSPTESAGNTLSFISVDPEIVSVGMITQFVVTIAYQAAEDLSLRIGFNDNFRDGFIVRANLDIAEGMSGEETFMVEGTPYDWGEGNEYVLYAWLVDSSGQAVTTNTYVLLLAD